MKNKIGWCSMTWNPAVGCRRNCDYCYGRAMNERFGFIKNWDNPEWKESNFNKRFPNKSQKIFVGSMSEIAHWREEWMSDVLDKIKKYTQHTFQFLSKYPSVYRKYVFPDNCWLGITITDNKETCYSDFRVAPENAGLIKFVSIEPILRRIEPESLHHLEVNWIIIGAETGQRSGKVIPKKDWIESIVRFCQDNDIPIYLKDSLKNIFPERIKEFPTGTELKLF